MGEIISKKSHEKRARIDRFIAKGDAQANAKDIPIGPSKPRRETAALETHRLGSSRSIAG